jgi:hypothetical protein
LNVAACAALPNACAEHPTGLEGSLDVDPKSTCGVLPFTAPHLRDAFPEVYLR